MNFHTLTGLMILIDMMLELKENALLYFSLTCSSWIWLSRGSTLRGVDARRFVQYSLLSYLLWGSLWKAQRFA